MTVRDVQFPVAPFKHQWEALEKGGNKYGFAFLMDPGTGKTKVTIDNAYWLYARGVINGLLVTGPGDVPHQWIHEQLPLYWPKPKELRCALWRSNSTRMKRECTELSTKPIERTFPVLAMNHEAMAIDSGELCAKTFLTAYKSMFVLDESDWFKTPKAQRTKAVLRLRDRALVRRILTGTVADTPFDLFSQFAFLDSRILGDSYFVFKHHYGVFAKEFAKYKDPKTGEMKTRPYESLQHYQRLEELYARIDKYSYRITKEQCTDLPPKLYSIIPTHLSDKQLALYTSVKETGVALLKKAEAGEPVTIHDLGLLSDEDLLEALQSSSNRVTSKIKLVVLLRLQQIVGGFITDDTKKVRCIDGDPAEVPRISATIDKVREVVRSGAKMIVWAQFRAELEALWGLLANTTRKDQRQFAELVHGDVTGDVRTRIFDKFKDPKSNLKVLIAHPKTAGTGMNFAVATAAAYYSDGYSYRQRKQSEDRIHRIGQTGTVNIYDLKALDVPIDENIALIRAAKKNLATTIMTWRSTDLEKLC